MARLIIRLVSSYICVYDAADVEHVTEREALDKTLAPWTGHNSPGKKRADYDDDSFSIKCVDLRLPLSTEEYLIVL